MQFQYIHSLTLFQAGCPQLFLSSFRELFMFLSFLVIVLGLDVCYIAILNFDKRIFHFILSHFVWGSFLLPFAINLFLQHWKNLNHLQTLLPRILFISWIHWPALGPLEPYCKRPIIVKTAHLFPPSLPCFFNIINAHRDPFLLSCDYLVFVGVFGEGHCKKLSRN